jgi:hypothetical protein
MSVRNHHYLLCNNTAEHTSHLLCGGNLKSYTFFLHHYYHYHSTMHTDMFEYIKVNLLKEHSLELWQIPPETPCIQYKQNHQCMVTAIWYESKHWHAVRTMETITINLVSRISCSICGRMPFLIPAFTKATPHGDMLILFSNFIRCAGGTFSWVQPNTNGVALEHDAVSFNYT